MKTLLSVFLSAFLLVASTTLFAQSSASSTWTQEKAEKWFKEGLFLNGMKLKPSGSINKLEFAIQYNKNKAYWDKAFKYMKETDLETVTPGKYYLDTTNVTVNITEGPSTKSFENTKWEFHKKYIDIQFIVKGKEKMGIAPISKVTVVEEYNETKDVGFGNATQESYEVAEPGKFLIFFPSDAHRPNIKVEGFDIVRKVVFKIKVD